MTLAQDAKQTSVSFHDVSKSYGARLALSGVTCAFTKNKIIGLVGPNGSGKSTMLRLIAGLLRPTRGTILVGGAPADRRSHFAAFAPDAGSLYRFYTVRQMAAFCEGVFRDFDRGRATELLERLEIEPDVRISTLSKGNRARVKMALTLARTAPLILMDEPLSGLDPIVRASIVRSVIAGIDLGEQTVILSTHEVTEVEPLLDEVVLLHRGQVRAARSVEEIQQEGYPRGVVGWMESVLAAKEGQGGQRPVGALSGH